VLMRGDIPRRRLGGKEEMAVTWCVGHVIGPGEWYFSSG
jgi:hypothetical protein